MENSIIVKKLSDILGSLAYEYGTEGSSYAELNKFILSLKQGIPSELEQENKKDQQEESKKADKKLEELGEKESKQGDTKDSERKSKK